MRSFRTDSQLAPELLEALFALSGLAMVCVWVVLVVLAGRAQFGGVATILIAILATFPIVGPIAAAAVCIEKARIRRHDLRREQLS